MSDSTFKVFKALGDEIRFEIVRDILNGHDTICPDIKAKINKSQPTLSHHIGKLVDAGILIESKKGVNCHYKVDTAFLKSIGVDLKALNNKTEL